MNLKKQIGEINILITIIGFYFILLIPFSIISIDELSKMRMFSENKIAMQKSITINPNVLKPEIFLNDKKISLVDNFNFNNINLIDKLHSSNTFYSIYSEDDLIGNGYIDNEGFLVIGDKKHTLKFKKLGTDLNIIDGLLSTDKEENIKVSFLRNGNILFSDDLNSIRKKLNFEEQFVKFYIDTAITKKNQLLLNKFVRDKNVYDKINNFDFDFDHFEIQEIKNITKSNKSNHRVYYAFLSPFKKKFKDMELYIYINENDDYAKYNSFHLLVEDIKIFQIDNDAIKEFENHLKNIASNLFKAGRLFDIEIILNDNNINISNKSNFIKSLLNTSDVQVNNISKSYSHEINNEIFKIDILNLNTYEKFYLVFIVDKNIVATGNKKITERKIVNAYIEKASK